MFSFLFASLFSWIFWIMYFGIGLLFIAVFMKHFAPASYIILFKRESAREARSITGKIIDGPEPYFIFILTFLFWPLVMAFVIIAYLFKWIVFDFLCYKIDSIIPDIEIKTKKG